MIGKKIYVDEGWEIHLSYPIHFAFPKNFYVRAIFHFQLNKTKKSVTFFFLVEWYCEYC